MVYPEKFTLEYVKQRILSSDVAGIDLETTGRDPLSCSILLVSLSTKEETFVLHNEDIQWLSGYRGLWLLANAKFDCSFLGMVGIKLRNVYDVILAERRIYQGFTRLSSLAQIAKRRLGIKLDKGEQMSFVGQDPATFVPTESQLQYAGSDTSCLFGIRDSQLSDIKKLDIEWITRLDSKLTGILAATENYGMKHYSDQWLAIAKKLEGPLKALEQSMYDYLQDRTELEFVDPTYFKRSASHQLKVQRLYKKDSEAARLFESEKILPIINFKSGKQVLSVIGALGLPLPMDKDAKTKKMKASVNKAALSEWSKEHGKNEFIDMYKSYKDKLHLYVTFGEQWVNKYVHSSTGLVHTNFKQVLTTTGRFASGDEGDKKGKMTRNARYNGQQIPKGEEYRKCFTSPRIDQGNIRVCTMDFSGCEATMMVGLSGDMSLLEVTQLPDQHAHMGTLCWRNIYLYRLGKQLGLCKNTKEFWEVREQILNLDPLDPKDQELLRLGKEYVMDKKTPEGDKARTKFKASGIFPVIYGVFSAKVAKIQGFSQEDGQIFIDTIEGQMPHVVEFVKEKAKHAVQKGYVVHNTRTNTRRWFPEAIEAIRNNRDMSFMDQIKVASAARNSGIQG